MSKAGIDPDTDTANEAAVEEFFAMSVQVETAESFPTLSGYAEGSYPEAQANGQQFDKDNGKVNPIATGKQEESKV